MADSAITADDGVDLSRRKFLTQATIATGAVGAVFVAVPAVLGYNWLLRRNKLIQDDVRNFSSDLHAYLVSGARVAA